MVRRRAALVACALLLGCGGETFSSAPDGAADAQVADAADAGHVPAAECLRDRDCGSSTLNVCQPDGVCARRPCGLGDGGVCPGGAWCIQGHCELPTCDACVAPNLCSRASGTCAPPVDPVACRARGGLYVRGRCLEPGEGDAECDGGYVGEWNAAACELPEVPGQAAGSSFREGAYPVLRVEAPIAGTLVAGRDPVRTRFRWSFAYVDSGGARSVSLELGSKIVDHRAYGCLAPRHPNFSTDDMCRALPIDSAFACDGLAVSAIGGSLVQLALAGRDSEGRLHVEMLDGIPESGRFALRQSFTSAHPSQVWAPLSFDYHSLWFRVGPEPPLDVVQLTAEGARLAHAGLGGGPEFVALSDSGLARMPSGELDIFNVVRISSPAALLEQAPRGRYHVLGGARFIAHVSLPLPSRLDFYDISLSALTRARSIENVGLYVRDAVARPLSDGGYELTTLDGVTLVDSSDVGGQILAIRDLAWASSWEPCVETAGSQHTLLAAVLEIRQSDGSVVQELWAVGLKS